MTRSQTINQKENPTKVKFKEFAMTTKTSLRRKGSSQSRDLKHAIKQPLLCLKCKRHPFSSKQLIPGQIPKTIITFPPNLRSTRAMIEGTKDETKRFRDSRDHSKRLEHYQRNPSTTFLSSSPDEIGLEKEQRTTGRPFLKPDKKKSRMKSAPMEINVSSFFPNDLPGSLLDANWARQKQDNSCIAKLRCRYFKR